MSFFVLKMQVTHFYRTRDRGWHATYGRAKCVLKQQKHNRLNFNTAMIIYYYITRFRAVFICHSIGWYCQES